MHIITYVQPFLNPPPSKFAGPNAHSISQMNDAVHDGLRAVKNTIEDSSVVAGAGAFEVAASVHLNNYKSQVKGKAKLGVAAFADALLIIPKVLAQNGGFDPQDVIVALQVGGGVEIWFEFERSGRRRRVGPIGIDRIWVLTKYV